MFRVVNQDKISTEIIRQIREAILTGQLHPGDQLPPEKNLLIKFGVSKQTLREALRALEVMGFLSIRKGASGGAVVVEVDMQTTRDSIANFLHFKNVSVRELSEARKILEPYLARLAAERLGPAEIRKLGDFNQACREALGPGEDIIGGKHEIEFHILLAQASGNAVLILILDLVNSLLRDIKLHLRPGMSFSKKVLAAHKRILDAIQAHDGERAAAEMYRHVCEVEKGLMAIHAQNTVLLKGQAKIS